MLNEWERFNTNRVNAASGSADAQYYMGTCYLNGRNVARDLARAEKWFALSAASGYVEAIRILKSRFLYTDERIEALLARMGEGGYCLGCSVCTYPKCGFGK